MKRAIGSGARHVNTRLARIASSRTSGLSSTPAPRTPARTYPPTPTPIARCAVSLLTRRRKKRRSWRRRQTGAVASKKALPRPPKKTPPRPPRQQQHRRPGAAPLPSPRLASQRLPRAARQAAAARRRLPSRRLPPRSSAQASPTTFAVQTARQHGQKSSSWQRQCGPPTARGALPLAHGGPAGSGAELRPREPCSATLEPLQSPAQSDVAVFGPPGEARVKVYFEQWGPAAC